MSTKVHAERKHSKYSASGAERYFNCPGSVALSEGLPDRDTPQSLEGTKAHEVLEKNLAKLSLELPKLNSITSDWETPQDMVTHVRDTANFILKLWKDNPLSTFMVETRIALPFIHPEMFGTFDSAVVGHFGTLDVIDFKYGRHLVSPTRNLQMIFYAMGVAHKYHWNFNKVRVWIIQPRANNFDWKRNPPAYWELSIKELRAYIPVFRKAVEKVERKPKLYKEGSWCYFCKAQKKCPLKNEKRDDEMLSRFS